MRRCKFETKLRPGEPVALDPLTVLAINLVVGAALAYAAYALTPKPQAPRGAGNSSVINNQVAGQNVVDGRRFAPKAGFDSLQNVVEMGSTVPLVYAKREEEVGGTTYGGVRVNTNLLWAQVTSSGGSQLLRHLPSGGGQARSA